MKDVFALIGALAGSYLGFVLYLYLAQRRLLFRPGRERPTIPPASPSALPSASLTGLQAIDLKTKDGLTLRGWYRPALSPDLATILYCQGNAGHIGDRLDRIAAYAAAGYGILLMGYRGYGGNPGAPSEAGLYRDAEAHLEFLAARGIAGDRLILFGESLGTAIAIEMAARGHGGRLILEAPFCSIPLSAWRLYPGFAWPFLIRDRFDSLAKIGRIEIPKFFIHGGKDRVTPIAFGRQLFAAAHPPKAGFFPEEAGHGDLLAYGMAEAVLHFLADGHAESVPLSPG